MELKLLLKRGALLAAANWPTVAIQFAAQATFHALLAVPILGAAILVAVLLGADLANLIQGSLRENFTLIANTLMAEPVALAAFIAAFGIVLLGGSILMFLVKGGIVDVILAADGAAGPIERAPLALRAIHEASRFSIRRFVQGCARLFRRYLVLGLMLMLVYLLSAVAYLAFLLYGYRLGGGFAIGWALTAALSAIGFVLWITAINVLYLLVQIVTASDDVRLGQALGRVARFVRAEIRELGGVFLVVFGMMLAATFVSALAWSGVGLIAFVPLVGLAVLPLQIVALLLRGLVFEYIGLTAVGAYVSLYRRYTARGQALSAASAAGASAGPPGSLESAAARSASWGDRTIG